MASVTDWLRVFSMTDKVRQSDLFHPSFGESGDANSYTYTMRPNWETYVYHPETG